MNPLVHIFATYLTLSFIIPDAHNYLIPIAVFAVFVDIDHFPGYAKLRLNAWQGKKPKLDNGQYARLVRTAIQEPIGIVILELLLFSLYVFGIRHILLFIAGVAIFMQWLIDFLTVPTRPFLPLKDDVVCLFFHTDKQRQISELITTGVLLILFLIVYF
jgi:hypothetical protein